METKKSIIQKMRQYNKATIAFDGLATENAVNEARAKIVQAVNDQVANYLKLHPKDEINVIISDKQISINNGQFVFLPKYTITGKLQVRSKDYIVGECFCQFADIIPKTFDQTENTIAFQTKNGNTVIMAK